MRFSVIWDNELNSLVNHGRHLEIVSPIFISNILYFKVINNENNTKISDVIGDYQSYDNAVKSDGISGRILELRELPKKEKASSVIFILKRVQSY